MTFPPCFSSFSARPGIDSSTNNRNMLRLNTIRHQQQQSRLFSTIVHHNEQGISPMHTPMRTFEPRSATPDLLPKDGSQDKDEDQDDYIEDDAARMLLALSQIVSKEISADSDCITRENRIFDRVHNKTERLQFHQDTTMKDLRVAASDRSGNRSNNAATIPKSIEIHNRGWGSSYISGTTTNPNSPLETKSIPNELLAPLSSAFSPLTPSTLSLNNNHINSFELFGPSTEQRARNRYRTVSLAGDEMIPDNYPELSPLLFPLSSPVLSRNLAASFEIHDSNDSPPHQISRRQLPRLLSNNQQNLEKETVSRALVGGGAKAFSVALAASAIDVPVAVITPVPEKPRPVLSFPTSKPNVEERRSNNGVVVSSTTKNNSGRSLIHENNTDDHKMHSPMDLPPLLFQSNNNKNNKSSSKHTPKVSVVVAPLCVKPYKQTASVRKAVTSKKQKLQQPAKGPRAKKKKTTPKRHTGKKFSWKAYPELEEFLITNREEYLSYSAKNYTIEQRDYNNRLTSRLLEHADASNYFTLFESCAFSAVRDRIRSYYKSYVQSFKRRKERQEQQERLKNLEMDRH